MVLQKVDSYGVS